jgi:sugar/nucleoside kinase (ribokinase family)
VEGLVPDEREARKAAGTDDLQEAITRLASMVPLVVVKLGPQGAVAQRGRERVTSPALKLTAVDAVGAGDSFDAGFLSQYVRGADLSTCLAMGNLAGGLSTTKAGGTEAFRDRKHREQFFKDHELTAAARPAKHLE